MIQRFIQMTLLCGIPFGLAMGLFFALIGSGNSLLLGLFAGVFFGVAIAIFSEVQRQRMESKDGQFEGETVVFQGPANHFFKNESRGGWLTLTSTRLCFRSHGTNFNNQPLNIPIEAIASVDATNTLGFIPNGLGVKIKAGYSDSGHTESFVVFGRSRWVQHINSLIAPPAFL